MTDEQYEINDRCQICCVFTGPRDFDGRYCYRCQSSDDLVPIPITELYPKGHILIALEPGPLFQGRPYVGFG
jgi:hypothetical protein